ncbi:GumC family protein [Winogradskyella tangerina]|uniref:GumC family protein n=1 Tax=Winogradskyella tangerina TaxID=2023240 RepID=UPI000DBE72A2|nr:polysaccharide biosynthesis tyrosine autokinase [Winogradskyella tangerina]
MESKPVSTTNEIRQSVELFLAQWKMLLLCAVIGIALGVTYLRYATNEYNASATIKIRDEKQSQKIPTMDEIASEGLFSDGTNKIKDEIETIKSRSLLRKVVKSLGLNISVYAEGNIKEREIYRNAPVSINFFENDSIIDRVGADIHIKVTSQTDFLLFDEKVKSLIDNGDEGGTPYAFGDRIEMGFGDVVITPNIGKHAPTIGSNLKIAISPVDRIVNKYQAAINITTDVGSSVIRLELNDTNSYKAVDILNQIIAEYNNDVLLDKEEVVKVTSDFINNRLQEVAAELGEVESSAELLAQQNNLTALGSQSDLNLQSKKQIQSQISSTATNIQMIAYLQEEIADENKISDMLPANIGIGDSNTAQVIKSHNELVAQRDRILKNSTEKNPVVIQLNNQIEALKTNLQNSLTSIKRTSELTLENLNAESNRISGQLYTAPTRARQLRGIKRQQDIKESLFLYLLQKREESAIRLGMYTPSAKIVDKAYSSHRPVAPNPMMVYLASLIFGLGIPVGLIYISDLIDTKIYTKEDLAKLVDIPFLGDIPKTSKKQKLVKKTDYSPKAEAFRIVRSNIDFMLRDLTGRSKKLFVTSTKAQEGKSHTSTNLATSISFSEKSVLLIEMDIRVPKILKYLEIDEKPAKGLSDYIADTSIKPQDVVVKHPENKFLDIIPSGSIPPNPSELLMSERVTQLFKFYENKYDYIIADTSAVGLVSDTLLISDHADIFIYVVSADNVDSRRLVSVVQPLYENKRLPNITMLLNGVKPGKKGYGYGYGYGNNPSKKKKWYQFGKK